MCSPRPQKFEITKSDSRQQLSPSADVSHPSFDIAEHWPLSGDPTVELRAQLPWLKNENYTEYTDEESEENYNHFAVEFDKDDAVEQDEKQEDPNDLEVSDDAAREKIREANINENWRFILIQKLTRKMTKTEKQEMTGEYKFFCEVLQYVKMNKNIDLKQFLNDLSETELKDLYENLQLILKKFSNQYCLLVIKDIGFRREFAIRHPIISDILKYMIIPLAIGAIIFFTAGAATIPALISLGTMGFGGGLHVLASWLTKKFPPARPEPSSTKATKSQPDMPAQANSTNHNGSYKRYGQTMKISSPKLSSASADDVPRHVETPALATPTQTHSLEPDPIGDVNAALARLM